MKRRAPLRIDSPDDLARKLREVYDRHYVYLLCHPRGGLQAPFYVGIGRGNRIFAHEDEARDSRVAGRKVEIIRSIWADGRQVMRFIDSVHQSEPWHREAELIVISGLSANRVFLDYQLAKRGISLTGAFEVQHLSTAIGLVAAGVGTAILPSSTLEDGARPGLCRIPLVGPVVKRKITVLRRRNATLSPAAGAFHELLVGTDGHR